MTLSPAAESRIRDLIVERPTTAGRRALVLGPAQPWTALLERSRYDVLVREELVEATLPPASFDLVVVVESLEHAPWDRWALQLCHQALTEDGRLVVAVPNFYGLASADAARFLAARAVRETGFRVRRALGWSPPRERFAGRRYRRAELQHMLVGLGFHVEASATVDPGWLASLTAVAPGVVQRASRTHVICCRRGPSLFGVSRERPYPDADTHRREFVRTHGSYLPGRDRWLASHPGFRPSTVQMFDPAPYRGRDVLVLCPHADDELIGCGGTLARLVAEGARVTILHATDGSEAASLWHAPVGSRRTVRLEEAQRVGDLMGFSSLLFWREDNASFVERNERVKDLIELLGRLRPALIFTPFITDVHPDHCVLSRMLARALRSGVDDLDGQRVLCYQVMTSVPASMVSDITDVVGLQERALLAYATAMRVDDYVHYCQDRNYHDAVAITGRPGFIETFFAASAGTYPDLVGSLEPLHA